MASPPSVLVRSVRRKSAAERRAQQLRSDTRCLQRLLGGLLDVDAHRGNQLSRVGRSLLGVLREDGYVKSEEKKAPSEDLGGSAHTDFVSGRTKHATFVPGASSHPGVAKVDEFVDRLIRSGSGPIGVGPILPSMPSSSSATVPPMPTLVLKQKGCSSEDYTTTPEDMEYIYFKRTWNR